MLHWKMTYTHPTLLTFHTHTHKNEDCWVIFLTSCTDSSSWLARSGIAVLVEILLSSPTLCRSWYPDTNCWRITWSVEGSSRGLCSMPDRSLWNWLIDNVYIHFKTIILNIWRGVTKSQWRSTRFMFLSQYWWPFEKAGIFEMPHFL